MSDDIGRMRLDWTRAMILADEMISDWNSRQDGELAKRIDGTPMSNDLRVYIACALQKGFLMAIDELAK